MGERSTRVHVDTKVYGSTCGAGQSIDMRAKSDGQKAKKGYSKILRGVKVQTSESVVRTEERCNEQVDHELLAHRTAHHLAHQLNARLWGVKHEAVVSRPQPIFQRVQCASVA